MSEKSCDFNLKIAIIGVGGAGGNAVDYIVKKKNSGNIKSEKDGVEFTSIEKQFENVIFIACNTDAQALSHSLVDDENKIQLGFELTKGLGSGTNPEIGRKAAEESIGLIIDRLKAYNTHLVILLGGMGGGTGTGACPVIARHAKEAGMLTIAAVSKPFMFEGNTRMRVAQEGIAALHSSVNTLLVIENDKILTMSTQHTTLNEAFGYSHNAAFDLALILTGSIAKRGFINIDFADVSHVFDDGGKAMIGRGWASGDRRAEEATEMALKVPLLDINEDDLKTAKYILVHIRGGNDMKMFEVYDAVNKAQSMLSSDGTNQRDILLGVAYDDDITDGNMYVEVIATGIASSNDMDLQPEIKEEDNSYLRHDKHNDYFSELREQEEDHQQFKWNSSQQNTWDNLWNTEQKQSQSPTQTSFQQQPGRWNRIWDTIKSTTKKPRN